MDVSVSRCWCMGLLVSGFITVPFSTGRSRERFTKKSFERNRHGPQRRTTTAALGRKVERRDVQKRTQDPFGRVVDDDFHAPQRDPTTLIVFELPVSVLPTVKLDAEGVPEVCHDQPDQAWYDQAFEQASGQVSGSGHLSCP